MIDFTHTYKCIYHHFKSSLILITNGNNDSFNSNLKRFAADNCNIKTIKKIYNNFMDSMRTSREIMKKRQLAFYSTRSSFCERTHQTFLCAAKYLHTVCVCICLGVFVLLTQMSVVELKWNIWVWVWWGKNVIFTQNNHWKMSDN